MKKLVLIASVFVCAFGLSDTAQAGEIVQCGTPADVHVETPDFTYCDIHDRRFAYKEKAQILQQEMLTRQQAFSDVRRRAIEAYKAKEDKINNLAEVGSEEDTAVETAAQETPAE